MTEITELATKIAAALSPHALWTIADVACYLHRSEQHTKQWIVKQDGFPHPLRVPSGKGPERPRPLWRSKDVIQWAESYVEV